MLDYSLEEISADGRLDRRRRESQQLQQRGRSKLASLPQPPAPPPRLRPTLRTSRLHSIFYVERFNRRDWDGLRELITADARLLVADRFAGPLANAPYFDRYQRMAVSWRMAVGEVEGQPAVIAQRLLAGRWAPHGIVRVELSGGLILRVADYSHCPWVLDAASSVRVESA